MRNYGEVVLQDGGYNKRNYSPRKAKLKYSQYKQKKNEDLSQVEKSYLGMLDEMRKL